MEIKNERNKMWWKTFGKDSKAIKEFCNIETVT